MTEATIFDDVPPNIIDTPPATPVIPTEVAELVGEGKKYKSVEDALKSVPHAQNHIKTLEEELAKMKEELTKRKTAEELLDEVKSGIQVGSTTQTVEFSQDKVVETVAKVLEAKEAQKVATANVTEVIEAFNAKFGEHGAEQFKQLASSTGLSLDYLNRLAATSPKAIFKLAGLDQVKEPAPAKPGSSVNTEAIRTVQPTGELSSRITGRSTSDMVNAWKIAGEKVKQSNG